ncbi:efflux RND transporter periplasmic adaptor subunit [Sporosarcina highlanderae]|uniref:Efflux RND transporter periplasmic adaptor subunit n=1 Tax=Sporosarcina highlanderae TaxID=3035916 RepID=A0ABT8JP75_9BACL|nr:efflux RND transporter periplasmic adaptor subunit [Sporosarcina highlanderae]MDN4605969.1 efflux RND transporter periplasmic adaptor subunit [Sporosarcina highlanderae]
MNKRMSITVALIVSTFIAVNVHLLFSENSMISKSVYVTKYERMTPGHFKEEIHKEGLISPQETFTVYVGNDETIEQWLVKEADKVRTGDEIALLQTEHAESQLAAWRSEEEGLLEQRNSIESIISNLESDRWSADDSTNANTTETLDETNIEVNINVQVSQDGTYAQAIAEAERELSEINRKLTVVQTQLTQNSARPALISPVDGTVANVNKFGTTLATELYSDAKLVTSYVSLEEWQKIEVGDSVRIQESNLNIVIEGNVLFISEVPATDDRWKQAYESLDSNERKNPLELYEILIQPADELSALPFGANVNAEITVNEADAVSVKIHWLESYTNGRAVAYKLDDHGRASKTEVIVPFESMNRAVITDGLKIGDVVIYDENLSKYRTPFKVFLPFPLELPEKENWRGFGWKNYIKYGFLE